MAKLNPGDPASDFAMADQEGRKVRLADFKRRKVLIYFYPRADTPGSTAQAGNVRDHRQEMAASRRPFHPRQVRAPGLRGC